MYREMISSNDELLHALEVFDEGQKRTIESRDKLIESLDRAAASSMFKVPEGSDVP